MCEQNIMYKKAKQAQMIFEDLVKKTGITPYPTVFIGDEAKREMFEKGAYEDNPFPGAMASELPRLRVPAIKSLFEEEIIPQTAAIAAVLAACSSVASEIGELRGDKLDGAESYCDMAFAGLQADRVFMANYTNEEFKMKRMMAAAHLRTALSGEWYKHKTRDGRLISMHAYYMNRFKALVEVLELKKPYDQYVLTTVEQDLPEVKAAVAKYDGVELEDKIFESGASAVVVRDREEWENSAVGKAVLAMPVVKVEKRADGKVSDWGRPNGRGPLSGIKVLDLTHIIAGAACSRILAEYGADVLLVRRGNFMNQEQCMNEYDGWAGKHLISLDFNIPEQLERTKELIKEADVITYTYRDGALDKFGLSEEEIRRMNPDVIYANLMCFSDTKWRERPGWAPCAEDITGVSVRNGSKEHPKNLNGVPMDYFPGFLLTLGTLQAIAKKLKEGGGYHVVTSLARGAQYLHECADFCDDWHETELSRVETSYESEEWSRMIHYVTGCAIPGECGFTSAAVVNTAYPPKKENLVFTEVDGWSQQ